MKLPSGPTYSPFVQTLQLIFKPHRFYEKNARTYGDTYLLKLFRLPPAIIFSNPRAIEEIFNADQDSLVVDNSILRPLLGEQSILLLNNKPHERQRKLLMPPFHGEKMKTYGSIITSIIEDNIKSWEVGQEISIRSITQEITLRVILQIVFGLERGVRYEELKPLLAAMLQKVASPLGAIVMFNRLLQQDFGYWSPWSIFTRLKQKIDNLLYAEIQERRINFNPQRTDILSLLLSAKDDEGSTMSDVELHDELITLLVAGQEATTSALSWAFYWVHYYPKIEDKLRKEINEQAIFSDPNSVTRLSYLNAVCQETLRIWPASVSTSLRCATAPIHIMDYSFDPGMILCPSIYLVHQREDLYPEPKQFKPERFLERQFSPYEYLPFGGGNRRCIGAAFALSQMKLVLATVLSHYKLELVDQRQQKPARRGVNFSPAGQMKMRVIAQL
jgi:cytochrome P450